jgi:fatty-acyl-CoA synthase
VLFRSDVVALVLENRPERVAAWLGICEAGAVAAPIDARLAPEALAAAIGASGARHVVVDAGLLPLFEAAAVHLTAMAAVWVFGPHAMAYLRIDEALDEVSAERLRPADRRPLAAGDEAIRLVTPTGTSHLSHGEVLRAMHAVSAATKAARDDRLVLPDLDLGAAALVLPGVTLTVGGSAVLGSRAEALAADIAASRGTLVAWDGRAATALMRSAAGSPATVRLGLAVERDAVEIAAEAGRFGATRALAWRGGGLETAGGATIRRDPSFEVSRSADNSSLVNARL